MIIRKPQFNQLLIIVAIAAFVGFILIPLLILTIESVSKSIKVGLAFQIGIVIIAPALILLWLFLFIRGDFKKAFLLQIMLLPITGRAQKVFGIEIVIENSSSIISLTTFMIFIFLILLFISKISIRRPNNRNFIIIERLLLSFVIIGTISQFINHSPWDAFWLSVGGLWQFLAIFYIISSLIKTHKDRRDLLKAIVVVLLISIGFRILARGDLFLVTGMETISNLGRGLTSLFRYVRIGSPTFGSPVYYGCYVTFVLVLSLYFIRTSKNRTYLLLWIMTTLILAFEMLVTFTRGATLSLFAVGALILFKGHQKFLKQMILAFFPFLLVLSTYLWELINYRGGFGSIVSFINDISLLSRLELFYLNLPHFFDNWGFGYGISKPLVFHLTTINLQRPPHNTLLMLSQSVGGIATVIFLVMFVYILRNLYSIAKKNDDDISPFIFISLLAWLVSANSTGPPLTFAVPYESVLLMYMVLFCGGLITQNVKLVDRENNDI